MIFSFGKRSHERIEIDVLRYERETSGNYHDDNWLIIRILIAVGGFKGKIDASIMTYELKDFLKLLLNLYKTLQGEATFETMEDQLKLKLCGDGKGHIELIGRVLDKAGVGNCLNFNLTFDQTELFGSISELEEVVNSFPVR